MKALADAYADPNDKIGKAAVVDIGPVKNLARPVTLEEIKADPSFKDFPLVRISRLAVMPVSEAEWDGIEERLSRARPSAWPAVPIGRAGSLARSRACSSPETPA